MQQSCRISESCNNAITQLRKIFENLHNFWANERETRKNGTNFIYLSKFYKAFLNSNILMSFLMHVQSQHLIAQKNLLLDSLESWLYTESLHCCDSDNISTLKVNSLPVCWIWTKSESPMFQFTEREMLGFLPKFCNK